MSKHSMQEFLDACYPNHSPKKEAVVSILHLLDGLDRDTAAEVLITCKTALDFNSFPVQTADLHV